MKDNIMTYLLLLHKDNNHVSILFFATKLNVSVMLAALSLSLCFFYLLLCIFSHPVL